MKIVVFGASGRVGHKVVNQLLANGHTVKAVVHNRNPFGDDKNLEVIKGDVHSVKDVHTAVKGCDAVVCALSSWGTTTQDIQVAAMTNIIPTMKVEGIQRIVSVTGAGVIAVNDPPSWFARLGRTFIRLVARRVFDDGERHLAMLYKSGLDWTVIRSPIMQEKGKPGRFTLSKRAPAPWATVVRDDVAKSMSDIVANSKWIKQSPYIKRK